MLYDLDFLKEGEIFPPKSELARLDAYRINDMLLNDEPWEALPEYKQRILYTLSNFALANPPTCYFYNANYWAELSDKVRELTFGNPPKISSVKYSEEIDDIVSDTELFEKCDEGVSDLVALGDWVVKITEAKNGKGTFINIDPSMWFPVVSRENVKNILYHVLAWIEFDGNKNRYELHVQIHERGKFTNRAFDIKKFKANSEYIVPETRQTIMFNSYEIGKEIDTDLNGFAIGEFQTGLDDFAVVATPNITNSRTIYGTSDFDRITDAVIEYNTRMTLKNVVLDKHSAPIMYGAPLTGSDNQELGNYLEIPEHGTVPAYLTWDASMTANENTITTVKKDISDLSGMGSILNEETFGESQGYDALMIKLSPALMRAARKTAKMEKSIKKILSLISEKGYSKIEPTDITVVWHSGVPMTESVRADIAKKHLEAGWSKKRVFMIDYGMTEEEADEELERLQAENPIVPAFGYTDDNDNNNEETGNDE